MQKAAHVAEQALCLKARCGSVIVHGSEIIGTGYNAPPNDNISIRRCDAKDKTPPRKNYDKTCCVHAEWRAISDALKNNANKLQGSILYFTRVDARGGILKSGEPFCTVCSRLALDVGIAFFVLWHEDGIRAYQTGEYNDMSYNYKE